MDGLETIENNLKHEIIELQELIENMQDKGVPSFNKSQELEQKQLELKNILKFLKKSG